MTQTNFLTVIDYGSSEIRLGVFDEKKNQLFCQSKSLFNINNEDNKKTTLNNLIKSAEKEISTHIEEGIILYDSKNFFQVDLCIKKNIEQKIFFNDFILNTLLEINQILSQSYRSKKIIHLMINQLLINNKEYSKNPKNIESNSQIILGFKCICIPDEEYLNLKKTFEKNNLEVKKLFSSSIVKSFYLLNLFKEKNLGFLDIGLERSTFIYFLDKRISYFSSSAIGGKNITKDISYVMKLDFNDSENIKKTFNKSELDFSYTSKKEEKQDFVKNILEKNISIDLLKKVVLARIEEIFDLVLKDVFNLKYNENRNELFLVLIGRGSNLFNKNSFHLEDKYNFKEITYYEETDSEICEAGIKFYESYKEYDSKTINSNNKIGFFERFFNFFSKS